MYPKWRLVSVLVRGGNIYSIGYSRLLSEPHLCDFSPSQPRPRVSEHAEVAALRNAPRASNGVLYTARIGRSHNVGLAKPCQDCQTAIIEANIKRVFYTINNNEYGVWYPRRDNESN